MAQPSAYEQYLLELINAERAKTGAQPLAFDGELNQAAESHSQWMIATDTFSHTGSGGSNPGARMTSAGYQFTGSWAWGENIAYATTRSPAGLQDEVLLLHTNLMNSPGHRANILNDSYREVGLGFETGDYGGRDTAFVTEDFAKSGTSVFLTGVAFDDKDGDHFYDVGEGLGGLTITATNNATGAKFVTTSMTAGGYDLALAAGAYTVTFAGGGFDTTTMQTTIGAKNVKLDLIDPIAGGGGGGGTPPPPPPPPSGDIVGTSASETINGTAADDHIFGLGGADRLYGQNGNDRIEGGLGDDRLYGGAGNDTLLGGDGADRLYGGEGADTLTGGAGADRFVFDAKPGATNVDVVTDFSVVDDVFAFENSVFTALGNSGALSSSRFYVGAAAHDSTDRIIYNSSTGALFYDADGTGSIAGVQVAQLQTGLALTSADFIVT